MIDLRLRTQVGGPELEAKWGKIITAADYNAVLTGPASVKKPDGSLLCVYLPGVLRSEVTPHVYGLLHSLRVFQTDNRGDASGTQRFRYGDDNRTRTKRVRSTIIGSFDPGGPKQFCRLTSWNAEHAERFTLLVPFFRKIAAHLAEHGGKKAQVQQEWADKTDPAWVIPGTPFTTITVNNTYPTGVHTDSGDLEQGLSTLAVVRRGTYTGGLLCFARYRVAVDMQDGDLLLMDAHEPHGNTAIERLDEYAERISVVSYYRTGMRNCGTMVEENAKAVAYAERRGHGRSAEGDGGGVEASTLAAGRLDEGATEGDGS